ncbi:SET domain-containing protein [Sphingosinicella sp.]|uniref:SET domain-containing protein n=1 Tax=Sphingosinicella sp. TaxID=1917971 RepID=UPI004037679C
MMMVDTELRASPIQGIGVFLTEPVRKGQLVWRFDSRMDRVYANAELESLPPATQDFIRTYSTWHEGMGLWVLCGDNGRHFNHSSEPNTLSHGIAFGDDVAARDLAAGEELTSDYQTICDAIRLNPPRYMMASSRPSASTLG